MRDEYSPADPNTWNRSIATNLSLGIDAPRSAPLNPTEHATILSLYELADAAYTRGVVLVAAGPNVGAFRGMQSLLERIDPDSIEKPKEKNPAAVALGKLGGAKGGAARAAKLSPDDRAGIARVAAMARWKKSGS